MSYIPQGISYPQGTHSTLQGLPYHTQGFPYSQHPASAPFASSQVGQTYAPGFMSSYSAGQYAPTTAGQYAPTYAAAPVSHPGTYQQTSAPMYANPSAQHYSRHAQETQAEGAPVSFELCQRHGLPQGAIWGRPGPSAAQQAGRPAAQAVPKSKYKTIQYIAFEICTMPMGFDQQKTPNSPEWYPGLDSPDADLAARVGIIARTLAKLDGHPSVVSSPSCLKLLMMPEFFFRGKKGAYSVGDILGDHRNTGSLSSQLASLVIDAKWADWMFVFGTVVGYKQAAKGQQSLQPTTTAVDDVYNIALVQPGGCQTVSNAIAKSINVVKLFKSGIDFLSHPSGVSAIADKDCRAAFHRDDRMDEITVPGAKDDLTIDDDGVFVVHDIVFGLEICLDHAQMRLKTITKPKPGRADSIGRIQVQLVPAGGMDLVPKSLCARPGMDQLAVLCDGLTRGSGGGYGAHSDIIQTNRTGRQAHVAPKSAVPVFDSHEQALPILSKLFNTTVQFAPTLRFYPELDLPPPSPIV